MHRMLIGPLVLALAATLVPSAYAQKRGGTLTIVRPTDPISLDPNLETTAPGAWVCFNMIEGLRRGYPGLPGYAPEPTG